jgi:peptidyl-prolyl cis-trans isomerase SurA
MKSLSQILMIALCLSAGALTLTAPAQADAATIDRIVARINAKIVTYFELKQAATPFMLQNGMDPSVLENDARRQEIYKEVLTDLVDRQLLLQEAAKLELSISDKEVDQWLAYTRQQQNMSEEQFREVIKQYDMSYSAYREMIRQNLLKIRLVKVKVGSQVKISDDELNQAFSERFGDAGAQSKFIEVRHILVRPEDDSEAAIAAAKQKAQTARAAIKGGADFSEVANAHSEGPSGDQGGYLGTFGRGDLDPQFEQVAFALDKGEVSEVVRTQFGYHVIEVMAVEMRSDDNVDERKAKLRAQMQQKAVERQLQAYLQNLRSRSFVDVRF